MVIPDKLLLILLRILIGAMMFIGILLLSTIDFPYNGVLP